ncbi:hypothetical protein C3747_15g71 [Trypanosoma cruzi]|uniref:Uncharacterized protein n=2 Tax=Trypanosoma cruzi TaxID=5693 RepID=Q4D3B8_TRYCC|nr:hypothetical protein, conserved [Trypanosoma cruzi]EAN87023.1 hypothetical protein, conserved [Trypanosoma cruzi]KAF8294627.1 hypothetical protein TcYC6_0099310 [Trypanosoma cruzi]PWV17943.1 hypothetical protein C3747_15g71 [Trypanosoma cruzi]|eukprot:XP_808874.1 hypothetical protein [Trypanosoma cruzi strain CL Brener]
MRWAAIVVRRQKQPPSLLHRCSGSMIMISSSCHGAGKRFLSAGEMSRYDANTCKSGTLTQWLFSSFQRRWRYFRAQRFSRKCLTLGTCVLLLSVGYFSLCVLVGWQLEASVHALFQPHEEYPLEEWSKVEPTLREGDVVLLMGTGITSWKIAIAQFAYSLMRPAALRFSHVAVVVEPAQLERWSAHSLSSTAASVDASGRCRPLFSSGTIADVLHRERSMLQRKQKRGVILMESVDNLDIHAPDVDGKVRHECVQLVEANHRLFGREGDRWCYNRFAVRRLKGFEWTPERKRRLRMFISENVGRPMDKSSLLVLCYIHPKLYEWTGARSKGTEISCGELIVDLYKFCGVIQKRMRMVPVTDAHAQSDGDVVINPDGSMSRPEWYYRRPSIQTAPYHFAEDMEVGVLDFAEGISLGPEVRMSLPGGEKQTR